MSARHRIRVVLPADHVCLVLDDRAHLVRGPVTATAPLYTACYRLHWAKSGTVTTTLPVRAVPLLHVLSPAEGGLMVAWLRGVLADIAADPPLLDRRVDHRTRQRGWRSRRPRPRRPEPWAVTKEPEPEPAADDADDEMDGGQLQGFECGPVSPPRR